MEDKTFSAKKESRLIDIFGIGLLIAVISVMVLGINTSIQSQREQRRNLEESGRLVRSEDGREYEFDRVDAFGHEYNIFRNGGSVFGVAHSPDCPCYSADKGGIQ